MFCAVGDGSLVTERVITSSDGINWATRTTPSINNYWYSVCWSPELHMFCAVGDGSVVTERVITRREGINRATRTTPSINK
jgi:hypothetical protein